MDRGRGSEWRHVWENEETRVEGAWVCRHDGDVMIFPKMLLPLRQTIL